ncbi:hypothetical protein NCCP2716_14950 [Sporosarcina sp. NCCP-2716]|uniref:hypothetical protein n=1 Tax=Sporosarcina sp. NCCP-2716 TaxID=2943679 RepID=UPI00203D48CF|nr:hypothetical protein [Sporosarcina sp. NCCP-2716]GKV68997.1 hypothetical protein NCCP2716_14950 [Sporosarcina sp. NCCP-2716]
MKKTLITAVSALMISAGGAQAATYAHAGQQADAQSSYSYVQHNTNYGQQVTQDITGLEEYASIASVIDPAAFTTRVTEDNVSNRVILFSDSYGRTQYKSVFVKKTGLLKVISEKGGGVVLQTTVTADTAAPAPEVKPEQKPEQQPSVKPEQPSSAISSLPEYGTLAAHVDLSALTPVVVSDNYNERTILLKDAKGQGQFKSIFVKRTGMLKIVNLKGGQIFYGAAQ